MTIPTPNSRTLLLRWPGRTDVLCPACHAEQLHVVLDGRTTSVGCPACGKTIARLQESCARDGAQSRGVTITGELAASGDDLGVSLSRSAGPASPAGVDGVFVRDTCCGTTLVPASEAILLDDPGVAPRSALLARACAV